MLRVLRASAALRAQRRLSSTALELLLHDDNDAPREWPLLPAAALAGDDGARGWRLPPVTLASTAAAIDSSVASLFGPPPPPHGVLVLGFDTEARPTFGRGGPRRRTALVQLASDRAVLLAHLPGLGGVLPPGLAALLSSPRVVLAGVGSVSDAARCADDFRLHRPTSAAAAAAAPAARVVDLGVAGALLGQQRLGLASLGLAHGLSVHAKPSRVTLSNWEAPLSAVQARYAAEDAYLGLLLLRRMHERHALPGEALHRWAAALAGHGSLAALLRGGAPALGPHPPPSLLAALDLRARDAADVKRNRRARRAAAEGRRAAAARAQADG